MLTEEQWKEMRPVFRRGYPREVVVAVYTDGTWEELENLHANPFQQFRLSPEDSAKLHEAHSAGRLHVFLHSHPDGDASVSDVDSASQLATGWTWGIVAVKGNPEGQVFSVAPPEYFGPAAPREPLTGRSYLWGVRDCLTLVRDYYALQGFHIDDVPRMAALHKGCAGDHPARTLFRDYLPKRGFVEVPRADRQPGDGFVMQLGRPYPSHCGIYLGNGQYLEHLLNRNSGIRTLPNEEDYLERTCARFYRPNSTPR